MLFSRMPFMIIQNWSEMLKGKLVQVSKDNKLKRKIGNDRGIFSICVLKGIVRIKYYSTILKKIMPKNIVKKKFKVTLNALDLDLKKKFDENLYRKFAIGVFFLLNLEL